MREMKESGIEWVGMVPSQWSSNKLKRVVSERFGGIWGNEEDIGISNVCLRIADFDFDKGTFRRKDLSEYTLRGYSSVQISKYRLRANDILIEKSGGGEKTPVGRAVLYSKDISAVFANFMECLRVKNSTVLPLFFEYWLRSLYHSRVTPFYIKQTTGIQNLDLTMLLSRELIFFPPIDEQERIANYLDKKCAEIDGLVADIQTEINTLEQYKRSVIIETVTKGINPNAEMKKSNLDYTASLPSTWAIHPLYFYFDERKHKNLLGKEQNLLSLSYGKIIRKDINSNGGLLPENYNGYNIIENGDIVLRLTDLQNDKKSLRVGLSKEHGIITSAYVTLTPRRNIISSFFYYELHSLDLLKVFYNMGNGVRQSLNYDELSKLMLFEPSIEEQSQIVRFIQSKEVEIDRAISDKKMQLDTLDAYKKSLIFEYVTGKKEIV